MTEKRRVVVTGLGVVSPLGCDVSEVWDAVCKGKSGIRPVEGFDVTDYPTKFAGEVTGFDVEAYLNRKEARKFDPFTHYGVGAAMDARENAGLVDANVDMNRVGVALGSGIGGISVIEENHRALHKGGVRKMSPFFVPGGIINMASGQFSIMSGAKGPNISMVTACTTGTHSIGIAARMIEHGDADIMYSGGAEHAVTPSTMAGFCRAQALSRRNDDPQAASRPWDKGRDGFVMSEGAAVLVLEELRHAEARGANILGEVIGFGMSGDAYHITQPAAGGDGGKRCMEAAIRDAGITPEAIDYINAHGTSTQIGDVAEVQGIRDCFGDHAKQVAISSTKSMTGHLLGAAGSIEALFCLLALRDGIIPPTINLDEPDEGCDLDFVPHSARKADIDIALSNSFGFGGTNGTLIMQRYKG